MRARTKCRVYRTHYTVCISSTKLLFGIGFFLHCPPNFSSQMLCALLSPYCSRPLTLSPHSDRLQTPLLVLPSVAELGFEEGSETLLTGLLWA